MFFKCFIHPILVYKWQSRIELVSLFETPVVAGTRRSLSPTPVLLRVQVEPPSPTAVLSADI